MLDNEVAYNVEGEIVGDDETGEFFAPVSSDMIDTILADYRLARLKVEEVAEIMADDRYYPVIGHFISANGGDNIGHLSVERLFKIDGAVADLNSVYWSKLLSLTDILDCMPEKRRSEWHELIRKRETPDFEEETVRATLADLLAMRHQFFAERVDGIFRSLSREHVTNRPEGFSKRMILYYAFCQWGYPDHSKAGYINDLRAVIGKFMGRGELKHNDTYSLLHGIKETGKWFVLDGGALRIKVFKKGTAHLEVHPDMAWKLNCVLASIYPQAIPTEFRKRPKERKNKDFDLLKRPLPFKVLEYIREMRDYGTQYKGIEGYTYHESYSNTYDKYVRREAHKALKLLGAVIDDKGMITFSYPPSAILNEILMSGCIPDQQTHQFYPTPENIALDVVEMADIRSGHSILEPSAGIGSLIDAHKAQADSDSNKITCVEINDLHCEILRKKCYSNVHCADFVKWYKKCDERFDRIIMNPPFSYGRAKDHVLTASELLKRDGILVAVLPASFIGKEFVEGFEHTYSRRYDNEFGDTNVGVVILRLERI